MADKLITTFPQGDAVYSKVLGVDAQGNTVLIKTEDIQFNAGNLAPVSQRLDAYEELGTSTSSSAWSEFQEGNPIKENGAVKIYAPNTASRHNGIRADGLLGLMTVGKEYVISFEVLSKSNIEFYLTAASGEGYFVVEVNSGEWTTYSKEITMSNTYTRLQICEGTNKSYTNDCFYVRNFSIKEKIAFDVSLIRNNTYFYGKKLSVMGDSISACPDTTAPQFTVLQQDIDNQTQLTGYPTYYDIGKTIGDVTVTEEMVGIETTFTPIEGDLGKTIGQSKTYVSSPIRDSMWWKLVADSFNMNVLANVSWSGSSITSHEDSNIQRKTSYSWHPASIAKLAQRDSQGVLQTPDVIIVYRGTNDLSHTPYSLLGTYSAESTAVPNTDYDGNGYNFKDAYAILISKLRETYPKSDIFICTLNVFKRIIYDHYPTRNGTYTLPQMNNAIREVANAMGVGLIEFDKDGITFENCYSEGYITDSATIPTHPNAKGHAQMAKKAIADMLAYITSL